MDKKALAEDLAKKTHLALPDAEKFVDSFFATIAEYFKRGERVIIADFGSFYLKEDKTIQFNPSVKFKEIIK